MRSCPPYSRLPYNLWSSLDVVFFHLSKPFESKLFWGISQESIAHRSQLSRKYGFSWT